MGITLILCASVFAALSNLCMRRSIDAGGTTKAFLMVQLAIACLIVIVLNPVRSAHYEWNTPVALLGVGAGLIFGFMMLTLGKALEKGPPGLTFAALNASTVMPGLIMAILFGAAFGYDYTLMNGIGSILVVFGLFWAGWSLQGMKHFSSWFLFVLAAYSFHILFLLFMQYRALLMNASENANVFRLLSSSDASGEWFMPMIYFSAAVLQVIIFTRTEKRVPFKGEWSYGVLGGIANGLCTFFLIRSTEVATPLENAMIFPIFSVAIILLCNSWGKVLYKEEVNWKACHLCVGGLLLGTVNWKALSQLLGF